MQIKCLFLIVSLLILLGVSTHSHAETVEYKLIINEQKVNITGKETTALTINNAIPGPTLKAKVGDIFRVKVTNNLDIDTSIHWHGVLVPNDMDGVPFINGPPIKAGETFTYEFPIKHSGTFWYHAHSALQEQQGLYGSLVFYPENEVKDYDEEYVLILSDWTNENPDNVLANLKKDSDYYALKKDSVQSWLKVLQNGSDAVKIRINNALTRMGPMDMSDIGYDAFLINGKQSSHLRDTKPGTRVKLRIINAAASSYFIFEYSGGPMKVIESDGVQISPFTAQKIRIAMAETYDVIVTIPDKRTYEFRASAEDGTGFAVVHFGEGELLSAPAYPKPNLVLMDMSGMDHGGMGGHDMSKMDMGKKKVDHSSMKMSSTAIKSDHDMKQTPMDHSAMKGMGSTDHGAMDMKSDESLSVEIPLQHIDYLSDYKLISSPVITTLPKGHPQRIVTLRLTGSMERYVWTINDTPMYAADEIVIKKGENVKFVLVNETMMNHPIHLHGHFFRVLNGQGDYSPLKHTVNVSPFETVEIEFDANEEKDWIFHCHNLYHMKLGMGGVIHYDGTVHDPVLKKHAGDHSSEHGNVWFHSLTIEGYSNFADVIAKLMRNDDNFIVDARYNYDKDHDIEATYLRYVSQFLGFYAGVKFERDDGDIKNRGVFGAVYTLPLLIDADLRVDTEGDLRLGLSNHHQLADRISLDWNWNTDKDYTIGLSYEVTKQIEFSGNYDSREKFGIGFNFKF